MNADSTEVMICPACGYELIVSAKAVTIVEDVINETIETIYALVFPYHEGDVRKGTECDLSLKLVDPKLREKYK